MQSKSFILLLLLLVIAGTGVFMLDQQQGNHHAEREPLLKGVDLAMLNKTEKLIMRGGGSGDTVSLIRDEDDDWYVAEKDNHPADIVKIRKLLTKLLETKRLEFKTDREDQYDDLGLRIPSTATEEEKGVQLDIYAPSLHKTLILGFDMQQTNAQYVRILQENGSWLVNKRFFDLDTNPTNWLNRQIIHIEPAEIHKVDIHFPDKQDISLVRAQRGEPLKLLGVPEGMQQKEGTAITGLATITDYLEFYEVIKKGNDYTPPEDSMTATFTNFDGLELYYVGYKKEDGQSYAVFSVRLNEKVHQQFVGDKLEIKAKILKDIKKLRERFDLWYYKIKGSVQDMLMTDMSQLTEPEQKVEVEAEPPLQP